MNILIIVGIVLGAGTGVVDRFFRKLPNWLAIVLYAIAVIMIIAGMIITKKSAR